MNELQGIVEEHRTISVVRRMVGDSGLGLGLQQVAIVQVAGYFRCVRDEALSVLQIEVITVALSPVVGVAIVVTYAMIGNRTCRTEMKTQTISVNVDMCVWLNIFWNFSYSRCKGLTNRNVSTSGQKSNNLRLNYSRRDLSD